MFPRVVVSATGLLGENVGRILATEVLVVLIAIEVPGPVLTSHWVHGGLDEDGVLVQSVDGIKRMVTFFHGQRLRRSTG